MVIYSMVFHARVKATCMAQQIAGHVKNHGGQLDNRHDRYHRTKNTQREKETPNSLRSSTATLAELAKLLLVFSIRFSIRYDVKSKNF